MFNQVLVWILFICMSSWSVIILLLFLAKYRQKIASEAFILLLKLLFKVNRQDILICVSLPAQDISSKSEVIKKQW